MKDNNEEAKKNSEEVLSEILACSNYVVYNKKLANFECEQYHFYFMMVVQVFQEYLNETTSFEILKYYK